MYDENDGFFDHMVPPTPPQSRAQGLSTVDTTNEVFAGNADFEAGPIGLGFRVPMIVISPWSKGGWVDSEVFDHTSLIRFIEERFGRSHPGLIETNITEWRRAVAGDLTSAFNFKTPNDAVVPLPSTTSYVPPDSDRHDDYVPVPPTSLSVPKQEPGVRPARAVPYELHVAADAEFSDRSVKIYFGNTGASAAVFQVRSGDGQNGPWTYTVSPGAYLSDSWDLPSDGPDTYDLSVYGPNGFFRAFKGSLAGRHKADLAVVSVYQPFAERPGITIDVHNRGREVANVNIVDAYSGKTLSHAIAAGRSLTWHWSLEESYGWYDLTIDVDSDPSFKRQLAGHVETGFDSASDPALGG